MKHGPRKSRTSQFGVALVVGLVLLSTTSLPADAHRDAPGTPYTTSVTIVSVSTTEDQFDTEFPDVWNADAELEGHYTVTHAGGHGTDSSYEQFQYGQPNETLMAVNHKIWEHGECSPYDPVTVTISVEEDDVTVDDDLGSATVRFAGPGTRTVTTTGSAGSARVVLRVVFASDGLSSQNIAACEFIDAEIGELPDDSNPSDVLVASLEEDPDLVRSSPLPEVVRGATRNSRINVAIDGDRTVGVRFDRQNRVELAHVGELPRPTYVVSLDRATARGISRSENPEFAALDAYDRGEIGIRATSFSGRAVLWTAQTTWKLLRFVGV